jgi:hypothetical protein
MTGQKIKIRLKLKNRRCLHDGGDKVESSFIFIPFSTGRDTFGTRYNLPDNI